jgi:hydrogenase maturation protease
MSAPGEARPAADRVIGIGNEWRRDDGAGRVVARRLAERRPSGVEVIEGSGEAAELIEAWTGARRVWIVDAVCSGAAPGTVHRFDALSGSAAAARPRGSSHALGLQAALDLARALDRLPRQLTVLGIEGKEFSDGDGLSPELDAALPGIVDGLEKELRACTKDRC